jgi:hypothetical protein
MLATTGAKTKTPPPQDHFILTFLNLMVLEKTFSNNKKVVPYPSMKTDLVMLQSTHGLYGSPQYAMLPWS